MDKYFVKSVGTLKKPICVICFISKSPGCDVTVSNPGLLLNTGPGKGEGVSVPNGLLFSKRVEFYTKFINYFPIQV